MDSSSLQTVYFVYGLINGFGLLLQCLMFPIIPAFGENIVTNIKRFTYEKLACKIVPLYYAWLLAILAVDLVVGGCIVMLSLVIEILCLCLYGLYILLTHCFSLPPDPILPQSVSP